MALVNGTQVRESVTLLSKFLDGHKDVERYRDKYITVDGSSLTTGAIVAAARYSASAELNNASVIKERVEKSRQVIVDKVFSGASVYGPSTGFGGSADTRTDKPLLLGHAPLQHQHIDILPTLYGPAQRLPLQDTAHSTIMPESWVSDISEDELAHSWAFWSEVRTYREDGRTLAHRCGTSYPIARQHFCFWRSLSAIIHRRRFCRQPSIQLFHGSRSSEYLGILNGTAFSAAVAALAVDDAVHLTLLAQKELIESFDFFAMHPEQHAKLSTQLSLIVGNAFEKTTIMDSADQRRQIAASTVLAIIQFFETNGVHGAPTISALSESRKRVAARAASPYLGKTRAVYESVRKDLGIKMHGAKNYGADGISDDVSIVQNISKIYEAD
ncbi:unnamed protein product [Cyclocybe aegerita]|uniref:Uncharacterized protein n=1 Tax=Cyclocybe aegerita TaxID=1973307 RepID=A0A8S0W9V3_CYCAE|nr:unnamed protein product [Cyclocybe aegerita]